MGGESKHTERGDKVMMKLGGCSEVWLRRGRETMRPTAPFTGTTQTSLVAMAGAKDATSAFARDLRFCRCSLLPLARSGSAIVSSASSVWQTFLHSLFRHQENAVSCGRHPVRNKCVFARVTHCLLFSSQGTCA